MLLGHAAAYSLPFAVNVMLNLFSFAAVIRVVTQCSSPTNGCSLEPCIPFLKLTNKEQASISWKPGPLAAIVTRNMIGAATNSYMHVVGSVTKGKECRARVSIKPWQNYRTKLEATSNNVGCCFQLCSIVLPGL